MQEPAGTTPMNRFEHSERRARTVAGLLERLGNSVYGDAYGDGLKPAQWSALRYFAAANRFSRTNSAFASYHGTTSAAASQTITALVERNLLRRRRDPADGRKYHLSLTSKAQRLIAADPMARLSRAAASLNPGELEVLAQKLEKVLARILEARTAKTFGYCEDCRFLACRRRSGAAADAYSCTQADEALSATELTELCINFAAREPAAAG